MSVYVQWVGTIQNGVVHKSTCGDEIVLLFRYMEEDRVWLLMRRMGFKQDIQMHENVVSDLIQHFYAATYERALGIHWNSGQYRTELERYAEDLFRYDRIDSYTHCPVVRYFEQY